MPDQAPAGACDRPRGAAISLIDVPWLESDGRGAAASEAERTTSIHSGPVCMLDVALSGDPDTAHGMYLVAPVAREEEVRAQIRRPVFSRVTDLKVRYRLYGELRADREAIMRFGRGLYPVEAPARDLR